MPLKQHTVLCSCGHARIVFEDESVSLRSDGSEIPLGEYRPTEETWLSKKAHYETRGLCRDCERKNEVETTVAKNQLFVVYDKAGSVAGHVNSRRAGGPSVGRGYHCVLATKCPRSDYEDAMRRREFKNQD